MEDLNSTAVIVIFVTSRQSHNSVNILVLRSGTCLDTKDIQAGKLKKKKKIIIVFG